VDLISSQKQLIWETPYYTSLELYLLSKYTDTDHLFIVLKNAPVSAREVLPTWDKQIQSLCYQVNQIIEKITNNDQEWITKAMEEQMVH